MIVGADNGIHILLLQGLAQGEGRSTGNTSSMAAEPFAAMRPVFTHEPLNSERAPAIHCLLANPLFKQELD